MKTLLDEAAHELACTWVLQLRMDGRPTTFGNVRCSPGEYHYLAKRWLLHESNYEDIARQGLYDGDPWYQAILEVRRKYGLS